MCRKTLSGVSPFVGKVRSLPGKVLWASCYNGPTRKHTQSGQLIKQAGPEHNHPVFSLNANYRFYTTGRGYGFIVPVGDNNQPEYADNKNINLQMLQAQASFPLTGRADIIDGQTSIGLYGFTSSAFRTINGIVVEPIRFDLHVPARVAARTKNPLGRAVESLSLRWGW